MEAVIEPLLLKHRDAQRALACGNTKYWELVKSGEIEVVGAGAMSRATYDSIKRYFSRLLAEAQANAA